MSNYGNRKVYFPSRNLEITTLPHHIDTYVILYQEHIIFFSHYSFVHANFSHFVSWNYKCTNLGRFILLSFSLSLGNMSTCTRNISLVPSTLPLCVSKLNDPSRFIIERQERQSLWNIHHVHYNLS